MALSRLGTIVGWLGLVVIGLLVVGVTCAWVLLPKKTLDAFRSETGLRRGVPETHLLPDGYEGWVIVRFGVEGASALETDEGALMYCYDETGVLVTSTEWNSGFKKQDYFYETANGRQSLARLVDERRIWGKISISAREHLEQTKAERRDAFFVGTREQYHRARPVWASPQQRSLGGDFAEVVESLERARGETP